ncbi:MAG: tRNA pseudouridine(38-40) synthase TruA [Candidatus Cloacimonetes bacterium]|nr:tRNA pseudouridine(38-40) synthase TruA [Candidatus Cloacimonadota bacterium]
MQRFLICLSYDGTDFNGWQTQPQGRTVQDILENILAEIASVPIAVTGSGRTDAKVHALRQYAHFDLNTRMSTSQIVSALNSRVPADIKIISCQQVNPDFSARYNAVSRTYNYYINLEYSPFSRHYAVHFPRFRFSPDSLLKCLPWFLGEHDFSAFAKHNPDLKHYRCIINSFKLLEKDGQIVLIIQANRFLHNMVRRIVGTCLRVCHTKSEPQVISSLITNCDPASNLIYTAPPQGLYLTQVEYPDIDSKTSI